MQLFFASKSGQRFFLTGRPLFFLCAGYDFGDLLAKAQQKDVGLQPFFMAGALLEVQRLARLPLTTPPLAMADLQTFMVALADRLLDSLRPTTDAG